MLRQRTPVAMCALLSAALAAIASAAAAAEPTTTAQPASRAKLLPRRPRTPTTEPFEGTVRQISLNMPVSALKPTVSKVTAEEVFAISDDRMAELASDPASGAQVLETIIKIDGKIFRVEMNVNGAPGFMLVDSASNTSSIVVPSAKSYVQWTAADRATAGAKQERESKAAEMLREQADKLPAADRERLKAALGEKGAPPTAGPLAKVEALEAVASVNGAYSSRFALREADKVSYAWLTQDYPELLAAFRAASAGQQAIRQSALTPIERFAEAGLPMRVQTLAADRYEQIDLVEIKREPIADEDMRIPEGFTKVDPNAPPPAAASAIGQPAAPPPAGATPGAAPAR